MVWEVTHSMYLPKLIHDKISHRTKYPEILKVFVYVGYLRSE